MSRSLSLTALQVNALTTSNDTILYNAQARDISLYGGTDLAGTITQLEINNISGDCLTLRHNSSNNNYSNFTLSSFGTLNLNVNNGDKSFNIVNHNGSTTGLKLAGVLVTATAAEINQLSGLSSAFDNLDYLDGVTAGTASAGKALITDSNNNISGINHLYTQDLTVNGVLVTATATELNYTDITTAGTAQPAKALVVDTNKDIVSIRNLSATNLTGTLQTASQPNITTIGTLNNLTVTSQITVGTLDANAILVDGVDITTAISGSDPTTGITPGTVSAGKVLLVDINKNLTGMGNLTSTGTITASTLTGTLSTASQPNVTTLGGVTSIGASGSTTITGILQTSAQTNITSVGTLTGLTSNGNVDIAQHDGSTTGLKIAGTLITATAADLNKLPNITATATEINKVAGVTPGTVTASKALVVDANKDLSTIRNLTLAGSLTGASTVSATTLTGTLSTASQPNITSVGTLGDLTVTNQVNTATVSTDSVILGGNDITSSLSNIGNLGGVTAGTVSASKVLLVDSSRNLTNMGNLTSTGTLSATTLTGVLSTAAQTAITSVGNLTNLTIANNGNIAMSGTGALTGAANVSATTLTGALSTAAQTAITSVGNLTNLTIAANGNLTMSGTGALTGAATISATTLTGTLSTAAQTSVTSLGTLTGLSSNGNVDIAQHDGSTKGLKLSGTLVTAIASELNTLAGVTAGTVTANKALVVDNNKDLSSIRNLTLTGTLSGITILTATTLTGALSTASQTAITSVGTLTGLTSNGILNIAQHNGTTLGLQLAGTLVTATATDLNKLSSISASASEINVLTGVTAGTALANKALIIDNNRDLTNVRNLTLTGTLSGITTLTATTLTGTLSTPAQTSITSIGTLTSLTLSGAISGVTTLTATTLAGTLSTASQPNITALGTLISPLKTLNSVPNSLAIESSSTNTLTNSSFTSEYDLYIKRNQLASGTTAGISFLHTSNDPTNTVPAASIITTRVALSSADMEFCTTSNTRFKIAANGVCSFTNTTDSTSSILGSVLLAGGLSINDATDSTSSTNGGSFTTAGGMAIAKSLYVGTNLIVGGNLTITGTTTTINSTTTNITDNTLILNSGPAGTGYDAGILTQRFQNNNSAGTGDVVNDTAKATFALATGSTTTTLVLPSGASSIDNFYTNWWIKITSGSQNNSVRQITNYVGSTRTATLNTVLSGSPALGNTINLYNKGYTSIFWNESNKEFATAFVSSDGSSTLNIIDYADMAMNNIIGFSTTTSTSSTTGALTLAGGIGISNVTDSTSSTNGGSFTTAGGMAIAKSLRVGTSINGANLVLSAGISGATTISSSGIFTNTNSTASTTNGTGAILLAGGIGISNSTDASSSTNGGTLTTAGGAAIAKSLYVGTNLIVGGNVSLTGSFQNFLSTASTSNTTGALLLAGGIGISNVTDSTSSTNGGSFTTAGGMAIAKSLRVGTSINCASISSSGLVTATSLNLGTATDNSAGRMLNVLDSTQSGTTRFIILGKTPANNNQFEIGFTHVSDGSTSNSASFGFFGQASRAINITASGIISIPNTSDSSSLTTGALTISGGISIAKNAWIGGNLSLNTQNTVRVSTTTPTSYMNLNDSPIYFRSTGANDKNHFITYCGNSQQTNWNTGKGFANPSTANDGPVLCGNANVIIGTMAGGSTETICGNFTSTGLTLAGNGISCPNPGYTLDFASNSQNMQISLFNGTFGIGACNTNLQSFSGGGHAWYTTSTAVQKNNMALSGPTTLMTLSTSGTLAVPGQIQTSTSGQGFSHNDGTINLVSFVNNTFNNAYAYFGVITNHGLIFHTHNTARITISNTGNVGIGTTPSGYILEVGFNTQTVSGGYGFINSTGAVGTGTTTNANNFSAKFNGRIAVASEVDIFSDRRIKENIRNITEDESERFINNIKPVHFKYKKENVNAYGYIAQDILKAGFDDIVQIHKEDGIEEIIDDDGFVSPKDHIFTVSYDEIPAILHTYILKQNDKIKNLEQKNKDLEDRIAKIEQFINTLELSE